MNYLISIEIVNDKPFEDNTDLGNQIVWLPKSGDLDTLLENIELAYATQYPGHEVRATMDCDINHKKEVL